MNAVLRLWVQELGAKQLSEHNNSYISLKASSCISQRSLRGALVSVSNGLGAVFKGEDVVRAQNRTSRIMTSLSLLKMLSTRLAGPMCSDQHHLVCPQCLWYMMLCKW
ncbi:TPA: hypothetical protein ACH3X2_007303 [Trebouxia sp. C0005]